MKVFQTGRKHCGKRRNCSLRAISPFPTVFSNDLYRRHVKNLGLFWKGWKGCRRTFSHIEKCKRLFEIRRWEVLIKPFPDTPFWDRPIFKEAADDNWNVAITGFLDTDCIENIVKNGEIAHFEQCHLFFLKFSKSFFLQCVEISIYGGKG